MGERYWSVDWWRADAERRGVKPDGEDAIGFYPHADIGGACDVLGDPWDCCPKWYAQFSSPAARRTAHKALKLYAWREKGALAAVTSLPLIPAQIDLVSLAERAVGWREQRQIEDIKRGA